MHTSPAFVCRYSDGVEIRMTCHCPSGLDLPRGLKLAAAAYASRTRGRTPPPITSARFERDGETIKQYSAEELLAGGAA